MENRRREPRQETVVGRLAIGTHDLPKVFAADLFDPRIARVEAQAAAIGEPLLSHLAQHRPQPKVEIERRRGSTTAFFFRNCPRSRGPNAEDRTPPPFTRGLRIWAARQHRPAMSANDFIPLYYRVYGMARFEGGDRMHQAR